jgi:hypothetical protein
LSLSLTAKDRVLKSLIELGINGFYPLFHPSWVDLAETDRNRPLSKKEKRKASEILQRLMKHKGIERKKIILLSLSEEDRTLFVRSFMDLVENKILDNKPSLH